MKRAGIKETERSTRGNTYIAAGRVTDHKRVGCPPCDTVYLQLTRDNAELLFMAITPEEAKILSDMLWRLWTLC